MATDSGVKLRIQPLSYRILDEVNFCEQFILCKNGSVSYQSNILRFIDLTYLFTYPCLNQGTGLNQASCNSKPPLFKPGGWFKPGYPGLN